MLNLVRRLLMGNKKEEVKKFHVEHKECDLCFKCVRSCPQWATYFDGDRMNIDMDKCHGCTICHVATVCDKKAVRREE